MQSASAGWGRRGGGGRGAASLGGKGWWRDARRIARAGGRGEARPRWLPGAGGMTGRFRPARGEQGASREQNRRSGALRASAVHVVGSGRACAGCGRVIRRRNARRHARAFPARNGSSPRRTAQGHTGNTRAAQPWKGARTMPLCATRAAPSAKETIGGERTGRELKS